MKIVKSALAAIAVSAALATGIQAAELGANKGQIIDLGVLGGVAYYTVENGDYRIVATLADEKSNAVRFEAVLAPGQAVVLSSPAARGEQPTRVEFRRSASGVEVVSAPMTN